ncbi:galactose-specific lectin nattectin-like [Aulostomus maculatus]
MASGLGSVVLLCLSGLWMGANAGDPSGVSCPPDWTQFEGRCYIFNSDEMDWAEAEETCASVDANLVSLYSRAQFAFLRDLIFGAAQSHKPAWLGGFLEEGVWLWSDGSSFDDLGWSEGEPDDDAEGEEDCMEMNTNEVDINDAACSLERSFICSLTP